jgi:hypothetical protein
MYKRPDFLDCPNKGEERRRIEISMRICFTWFPNWLVLGEPIYTRTWFVLQCVWILLGIFWRESYDVLG